MQVSIGGANTGYKRFDEMARRDDGWRPPTLLDERASFAQSGCGNPDPLAEAPTNDSPTRQVGDTDIDFTHKFLEQAMDIACDDVSPVM
jgi:hypothetical protein